MGILASLFGQLKHSSDRKHRAGRAGMPRANPYINPMLDNSSPLMDRTTFDRTPQFRDPMQAGPEPPRGTGPLSEMFGGNSGRPVQYVPGTLGAMSFKQDDPVQEAVRKADMNGELFNWRKYMPGGDTGQ